MHVSILVTATPVAVMVGARCQDSHLEIGLAKGEDKVPPQCWETTLFKYPGKHLGTKASKNLETLNVRSNHVMLKDTDTPNLEPENKRMPYGNT